MQDRPPLSWGQGSWLPGVPCPVFLCLPLPPGPLQACWVNAQKVGKPGRERRELLYWGLWGGRWGEVYMMRLRGRVYRTEIRERGNLFSLLRGGDVLSCQTLFLWDMRLQWGTRASLPVLTAETRTGPF